jgi:hypothetical protein
LTVQLLGRQKWEPGNIKQIKGIYFILLNENILGVCVLGIRKHRIINTPHLPIGFLKSGPAEFLT